MAERDGLENRCTLTGTQGSNPCLSANLKSEGMPLWRALCICIWMQGSGGGEGDRNEEIGMGGGDEKIKFFQECMILTHFGVERVVILQMRMVGDE